MNIQFPYRITVTRDRPAEGAPRRGHPIARGAAMVAGVVAMVFAPVVAGASAAMAAGNNAITATIPLATKSVTVSVSTLTYGSCTDSNGVATSGLTFPNGNCLTGSYTVQNGGVASNINVQGAPATRTGGGGITWAMCNPSGTGDPACTGAGGPGADQFRETNASGSASQDLHSSTPACDAVFNGGAGCAATANQAATEHLTLRGPASSTDPSSSFTTTVTYTAV